MAASHGGTSFRSSAWSCTNEVPGNVRWMVLVMNRGDSKVKIKYNDVKFNAKLTSKS